MEKVKTALAKARKERAAKFAKQAATVESTPSPDNVALIAPEYKTTRFVELDLSALRQRRVLVDGDQPTHADEAYKVLRTRLLQRMRASKWNSVAITSPSPGNGKSLTALNLAICLARDVNQTVLLVDLDLRRPNIYNLLGLDEGPGISDYLTRDVPLADILIDPGIDRLTILPGSQSFTHSSELLASPKMVQLARELRTRYASRFILFDMPPILACDDVIAFSPHVDATLLVVEESRTKRQELVSAVELLENTNFLGWVLNKSHEHSARYGAYGYGYGYGYGYRPRRNNQVDQ